MKNILLLLISALWLCESNGQARQGWMGVQGNFFNDRLVVDTTLPRSTFQKLGIRKGDSIISINEQLVNSPENFRNATSALREGDPVLVNFQRGGQEKLSRGKAVGLPFLTSDQMQINYDWVAHGNCSLRTIVRKPRSGDKFPAILLVPGYNCGSIENFHLGSYGPLIETWIKAGFAVATVEKSGLGDSYNCQPCSEADLITDIQTFDAGYRYMKSLSFADTGNLFIWGHSMGGIIAPELARRHYPRGVIVFATVFRPWSEFLLEMHRVQYPLDGLSFTETEQKVRLLQKVYYEFFRLKRSPAELYRNPEYRDIVASELEYKEPYTGNMWGRHWRFWQQIDSLDMAASWSAVKSPVLSLFGGADFIACSLLEHELITRTIESVRPGNVIHITIPDVDHLLIRNVNWESAHSNFSRKAYREANFHQGLADSTVVWMRKQMQPSAD